jgi:hypothetical protein
LSGSEQGDQFVGLSLAEAELAIEQAVLMHAPRWGDPTLDEIAPNPATVEERAAVLSMFYSMMLPAFMERLGARLEEPIARIVQDFAPHVERWAQGSGTPLTLAHYDYRPDNFLFARTSEAPPYMIAGSFTPERRRDVERDLLESYRTRMNAAGVAYDADTCWRDYRFGSLWGLVITVLATSMAARTERGDDLFVKMATQHGQQALDHDALDLVK